MWICRIKIVAPFVGAWIEIFKMSRSPFLENVAPFVGAWIEIPKLHHGSIISKAEELMAEELITESSVNSEMQTYKTGKDHLQRYRLYEEIDDIVRKLYSVTDEEYEFIKQSLSGDKYML